MAAFLVFSIPLAVAQMEDDQTAPMMEPLDDDPSAERVAAGSVLPFEEYAAKMDAAKQVGPLKDDLFGDNVSLYNGQTEFSTVDIDIPGNSKLPVQLRRTFAVVPKSNGGDPTLFGGFENWAVEVPYISGVFRSGNQWNRNAPERPRCSGPLNLGTQGAYPLGIGPMDVFSSPKVHIPGRGDHDLMYRSAYLPVNGNNH